MARPVRLTLFDAYPDAVVVVDELGNVLDANPAAQRLTGEDPEAWIGRSGTELVHPDDSNLAMAALTSVQQKEVGTPIELRIRTSTGWRLVEVVGSRLEDGGIILALRDLTQRRRWEVAGDETAMFRAIVQYAATITMLLDRDGLVASVSGAVARQLGLDPEHVCGRPLAELVHEEDRPGVEEAVQRATVAPPGASPGTVEALFRHAAGFCIPFELSLVSLLDDATVEGIVVSAHDITRLREAQDVLAELANFDPLTGLANRRAFEVALEREWALTRRNGLETYVLVGDLDGFKALNDRCGHAVGDEALREVANALLLSVRETDVVARLGGDEFAILLVRYGGEAAAAAFEEEVRARIVERLRGLPQRIDMTIGAAPLSGSPSPAGALHRADMAMLRRKRAVG